MPSHEHLGSIGSEPKRWAVAGYLLAQGLGAIAWWAAMFWSTDVRGWFVPAGWDAARTVAIADLVAFGGGSIICGLLVRSSNRWAPTALGVLVGVALYATLVAVGWAFDPIGHWLGLVVMVPALAATIGAAIVSRTEVGVD